MAAGLVAAWAAGEAISIWRQVHVSHHLPVPGELLGITGLFAALGVVSEVAPRAAGLITLTAWGLVLAGVLNVLPKGLGGQIQQTEQAQGA